MQRRGLNRRAICRWGSSNASRNHVGILSMLGSLDVLKSDFFHHTDSSNIIDQSFDSLLAHLVSVDHGDVPWMKLRAGWFMNGCPCRDVN